MSTQGPPAREAAYTSKRERNGHWRRCSSGLLWSPSWQVEVSVSMHNSTEMWGVFVIGQADREVDFPNHGPWQCCITATPGVSTHL